MYRDVDHAMRATDPALSPALREINQELVQKGNMRIVAALFQGTRQLTSKEKVLSVKDMQGKKYRGVPIKLWSSMLTGMGAVATPVEVSELATALATGLVVGQENPLPNIYNLKLYEVQKYVMLTGHMQSILSVFVNERAWQQIPAADRKIVEATMIEVGKKTWTGTARPPPSTARTSRRRAWCSSSRRTVSTSRASASRCSRR